MKNITTVMALFVTVCNTNAVEINKDKWQRVLEGKDKNIVTYVQTAVRERSIVTNTIHYYEEKGDDFIMQIVDVAELPENKPIYRISIYTKKSENIPYSVGVSGNVSYGEVAIHRTPYGKYKNETIMEFGMLQQIPSLVLELNSGVYEIVPYKF